MEPSSTGDLRLRGAPEVAEILGINRRRDGDLREMVRALELWRWFNTPEDEQRLAAAKWALNWHEYQMECNRRRTGAHNDGTAAHSRLWQADSVNPVA